MPRASIKGVSSIDQDLAEIESCRKQANGPNQFVIGAIGAQIKSTYRLEETIKANIRESQKITESIKSFEKSTNKTENVMLILAGAQVLLAAVQIAKEFGFFDYVSSFLYQ